MKEDVKLEDFIKYTKEEYGLDITIVPSDKPDTFNTFFKSSNFKSSNLIEETNKEED